VTLYAQEAADALADLQEAGAAVTFVGAIPGTAGVYDPATDTWSVGTPATDAPGIALQMPGDPATYRALSLIELNPITLMVAASGLGITLHPGMPLVWAGKAYTIRTADPFAPDGTPIYWDVVGST
jgi:hypothetical protein